MSSMPSKPLTVSQLTQQIKLALNTSFSGLLVQGEISELTRSQAGHIYFSLKDANAKISCVMWRSSAERLKMRIESGLKVTCYGGLDVYPARGNYQFIAQRIEPVGQGELQLALKQLREKLAAAGLFDPGRKRPLPVLPERVAVVTSPDGAAIRDFLQILLRRYPNVEVTIAPTRVQGDGSAQEIAEAIALANRMRPAADVLVVCRGGGSLEDLWSFNEEVVCRAIFASKIPVITGIGHETDVSLADLVADVRALTPSEAAERIAPQKIDLLDALRQGRSRLKTALQNRYRKSLAVLQSLADRPALTRPFDQMNQHRQRLDEFGERLNDSMFDATSEARQRLTELAGKLDVLSPVGILTRGYSVTTDIKGVVVRSVSQVQSSLQITTRVQDGTIESVVVQSQPLEDVE